ncbi:MAG: radical SAM protein [Deltaproteobacteria bacterium]|nr:radical SAM protein [Deltaproteobacteria bacterium]
MGKGADISAIANDALSEKISLIREISKYRDRVIERVLGIRMRRIAWEECLGSWREFSAQAKEGKTYPCTVMYIHIPLCLSKCFYCVCESKKAASAAEIREYLDALHFEIDLYREVIGDLPLKALYVGGGTPSMLSEDQIDGLFSHLFTSFTREKDFHFGFEMNPQSTTPGKLRVLKRHGVTRISFGVQSLNREVLKSINRDYQTREMVERAVVAAREAGVRGINLDVVAGLPGETGESFVETLKICADLNPGTLIVYRWLIDNTPVFQYNLAISETEKANREKLMRLGDGFLRGYKPSLSAETEIGDGVYAAGYVWEDTWENANVYEDLRQGGASVAGIGYGAESHIHGRLIYSTIREWENYLKSYMDTGAKLFVGRGISGGFEEAFHLSNNISRYFISRENFKRIFGRDLEEAYGREIACLLDGKLIRFDGRNYAIEPNLSQPDQLMLSSLFFSADELRDCLNETLKEEYKGDVKNAAHPALARSDNVALHLQRVCNARCKSCPWELDGADITDEEINSALGRLSGEKKRLDLIGGEAAINRRFLKVVREAKLRGADEVIAWTNGRVFSYMNFARKAMEAGMTGAVFSVHGSDPESHDSATSVPGSFLESSKGIENLRAAGLDDITVRAIIGAGNAHHLSGILKAFSVKGIRKFLIELVEDIDGRAVCDALHIATEGSLTIETFRRKRV